MKIIIVGCGNVGSTLVEQLGREGHDIVVIDRNSEKLESVTSRFDVMGIVGNGASFGIQRDAGVETADILIAVTPSDERNLLCCLIAKKAGHCNTIARVRDPIYSTEIDFIKKEMGLSMVLNPEQAAAAEIARLLRFPSAIEVDPFAGGKIDLLKCKVGNCPLCQLKIKDIPTALHSEVLVCAVERGDQVTIPDGNFVLQEGDFISVVASPKNARDFFKKIGMESQTIRNIIIIGGGGTPFYLSQLLTPLGIHVKIIEKNKERSKVLSENLPEAMIIYGDGMETGLLEEEGLPKTHAFVAWTDMDEENVMLSLYARHNSEAKVITRIHRLGYEEIVEGMDLGSVFFPEYITAEYIIRYVRAMTASVGSDMEAMYRLMDNQVEAMEFSITEPSAVVGKTLSQLRLKKNLLLCSINRKGKIIIPGGQDTIEVGDSVVVVTTNTGFDDITDILLA